jgi:hypothetical protein
MAGFLLLVAGQALAVQNHLLIISGIAGDEEFRQQFADMSLSLYRSASDAGITKNNIIMLSAQPQARTPGAHQVSDRQTIHNTLMEINARAQPDDRIFVVLIGHGNPRGDSAVFNLPGPDLSAGELAEALEVFEDQALTIINTACQRAIYQGPDPGKSNNHYRDIKRPGIQRADFWRAIYFRVRKTRGGPG